MLAPNVETAFKCSYCLVEPVSISFALAVRGGSSRCDVSLSHSGSNRRNIYPSKTHGCFLAFGTTCSSPIMITKFSI